MPKIPKDYFCKYHKMTKAQASRKAQSEGGKVFKLGKGENSYAVFKKKRWS